MPEYIEREKLLELLENRKIQYPIETWQKCGFEGGWHDAIDEIEDDIKSIPAADVAPVVHGKWKHVAGMNSKCSECGHYFPVIEFEKRPFDINYCPNCGAKMDGKDGEQE